MCKFWILFVGFLVSEGLLALIFSIIAEVYYKKAKGFDFKSIFKGIFERIFLAIALIHNLPHALTFFSALKLATRLKHTEEKNEHNDFNDYYLLGNLASVLVAIGYSYLYLNFEKIEIFIKICNLTNPSH